MASPDLPTKLGFHSSKAVLDYESFFIARPRHESNRIIGEFLILFVVGSKRNHERSIRIRKKVTHRRVGSFAQKQFQQDTNGTPPGGVGLIGTSQTINKQRML